MTAATQRSIIVVTADLQAAANLQALVVDPVGGGNAFAVGLSATGTGPATHYWCNWQLAPSEKTTLLGLLMGLPLANLKVTSYDLDDVDPGIGKPTSESVLQTMGLKVVGRSR